MHEAEKDYAAQTASARVERTDRKPFASHDARNQAPPRQDTSLHALVDRLAKMAEVHGAGLHGVAGQLEQHADRLHGSVTEPDSAHGLSEAPYYGDGLLAQVWVMVDNLDDVLNRSIGRVALQAGRNCSIA